jgi:hypothetical protein
VPFVASTNRRSYPQPVGGAGLSTLNTRDTREFNSNPFLVFYDQVLGMGLIKHCSCSRVEQKGVV